MFGKQLLGFALFFTVLWVLPINQVSAAKGKYSKQIKALQTGTYEQAKKAVIELSKYGPDAVVALMYAVIRKEQAIETVASHRIEELKEKAVPYLFKSIALNHSKIRSKALQLAWSYRFGREKYIPILVKALSDPSPRTVGYTCVFLSVYGPKSSLAIPKLFRLIQTTNPYVMKHATYTLAAILKGNRSYDARVVKLLKSKRPQTRAGASMLLEKMGKDAKVFLPHLAKLLKDPIALVRMQGASAIGSLRGFGESLLPNLFAILNDKNKHVRWYAVGALGAIGKQPKIVVPYLIKAMSDPYDKVRVTAISALTQMGPEAALAIPKLLLSLKDKDAFVRLYTAQAFGNIGAKARATLPQLRALLQDKDGSVQYMARRSIAKIQKALRQAATRPSATATKKRTFSTPSQSMSSPTVPR